MKIAISSTGETLSSDLDPRFGRAAYYLIIDTETEKIIESINNLENVNITGGAGTSAAQLVANKNVEAVISGNYGPNASRGLASFEIKMFQSNVKKITEVIADLKAGTLIEVKSATVPGSH